MISELKKYFPMIRNREEVLEEINNSVLLSDQYNNWSTDRQKEFLDICTGVRGNKMISELKKYFPMIRNREEVLEEINNSVLLSDQYNNWSTDRQQEFLDICTGVRGIKILYDSFFKEIMNPEYAPERMNDMLSIFLNKKVKIKEVLPVDSTRLGDERNLIMMDIVVELEDGSIADVEVQKIGYAFPGQRMACYSADMLLRQYKRLRDSKKKKFSYKDIGKVYTIIFFEKSPVEIAEYDDVYIHRGKQAFDTGLELNLLQEYVLVSLDIFNEIKQNESINNKLEAWLTFLGTDSPELIVKLISSNPEFVPLYNDMYELCLNTEKVMGMFSKELAELDRNTVDYMVDQMQQEIDEQKDVIDEQKDIISEKDRALDEKDRALDEKDKALDEKDNIIDELRNRILELENGNR